MASWESVTFAPDYATFVTTGQDGAVKLWDAATQRLLGSVLPLGPNQRVLASFLAADRLLIYSDTGDLFGLPRRRVRCDVPTNAIARSSL